MSEVKRKTTYRLYPNAGQEVVMTEHMGLYCRVANTLIEEHRHRYEGGLPKYSFSAMCKDITRWRSVSSALESLNAQSLQVTAKRVSLAFEAFFRRVKSGETPGYPRFKAVNRFKGWGYKTHGDGWRFFEAPTPEGGKAPRKHTLRLSGIGEMPVRGKGRFSGIPKTCEIIHKQGKWYASITFSTSSEAVARMPGNEVGAFDWGLETLLTIAKRDGSIETIENPRWLKKRLQGIKDIQKAISVEETKIRLRLGLSNDEPVHHSQRTLKLRRLFRQLSSVHGKVARQRHDFYHKLSALLISRFSSLASEALNVEKMVKRPKKIKGETPAEHLPNGASRKAKLNRSILDAAPAGLLKMIATKAVEAGSLFALADTKKMKPTQRCHKCGALVAKELSDRWHTCPECHCHCKRDDNSALALVRWLTEGEFWLRDDPSSGFTVGDRQAA